MAFLASGAGALDYFPCRYGGSRLTFRGPKRDLSGDYIVFLGSSESYGPFVPAPFPTLVEERLGIEVANLACMNAGPDAYLGDPGALEVIAGARVAVLQVMGALNLSNRFYTVHPRRNDRFIAATPQLRALFRDVDFTEINFTRHLIRTLVKRGDDRFAPVAEELRNVWVARMTALLHILPPRRVLLWTADHPPLPRGEAGPFLAPELVDAEMVAALRPLAPGYVQHVASPAARAEGLRAMRFAAAEARMARGQPAEAVHREAAAAVLPVLEGLL